MVRMSGFKETVKLLKEILLTIKHYILSLLSPYVSRPLLKKLFIVFALVILSSSIVLALVYLSWEIELTGEIPPVRFYKWDEAKEYNTISLSYSIYPEAWIRVKNATFGIINRSDREMNVSLWIQEISDVTKVSDIIVNIISPNGDIIATYTWSGGDIGENTAVSFILMPKTIYTVEIWIKGSEYVTEYDVLHLSIMLRINNL